MTKTNEMTGRRALFAADTDRTQAYVFESARLPEIRGASNLLRRLNEQETPSLISDLDPTARQIYAGGGGLLYEVDAAKAEEIKRALETSYPKRTGVATITCVYRVLPEAGASAGLPAAERPAPERIEKLSSWQRRRWDAEVDRDLNCFGAWVRLLGEDLRRAKQQKLHAPFVESSSHAQRCQSCQTRPAARLVPHYEESQALCHECREKWEYSCRYTWRDEFDQRLQTWYPALAQRYFAYAEQGLIPRDIEVIASACRPHNHNKRNYVAFIYADGDGVGGFVESRRTRKEYESVSRLLREATWRALTYSLANNLSIVPLENSSVDRLSEVGSSVPTQPFEIITVGGDDVMLIVPAHAALGVAQDMASEFRSFLEGQAIERNSELRRPLTLSVGMVIGPAHMPVRLMRDFAQNLLKKSAKPEARKGREAAIDFQIFTSTALYGADVLDTRSRVPYTVVPPGRKRDDGELLSLTCRPYTLSTLGKLREALHAMQQVTFPTSQLHQLVAALEQGRWRSTIFYLNQRSRLQDAHRQALELVETILTRPDGEVAPWYEIEVDGPYAYRTALRDVAELYDFVPETEEVFL
jgi:CRISPR-associated protein Cmr2